MSPPHTVELSYTRYDVFTTTRYVGNPLAIVDVPASAPLTQTQKQNIAREFNLSEITFVHPPVDESQSIFPVDIFTSLEEIRFAGHPTVGTGFHLLSKYPEKEEITLRVKAGDIRVVRESGGARLQVPVDFKDHGPYFHPTAKSIQKALKPEDFANGVDAAEPVASIVKGMSFILLQLTSEKALNKMSVYPERIRVSAEHLEGWGRDGGKSDRAILYAFVLANKGDVTEVKSRMFALPGHEDPATGSAASTLGGWLALRKGRGKWKFNIQQGVAMGRESNITVFVEVGDQDKLAKIELAGSAVEVMNGTIFV